MKIGKQKCNTICNQCFFEFKFGNSFYGLNFVD